MRTNARLPTTPVAPGPLSNLVRLALLRARRRQERVAVSGKKRRTARRGR
jgi:hypothetical protein